MRTFIEFHEDIQTSQLMREAAKAMAYFGIEPNDLLCEAIEMALIEEKDSDTHRLLLEFQEQGVMGGVGRAARGAWDFVRGMGQNFQQGWQSKDQGPQAMENIYGQLQRIKQQIQNAGLEQQLGGSVDQLMNQMVNTYDQMYGQGQGQEPPAEAEIVPPQTTTPAAGAMPPGAPGSPTNPYGQTRTPPARRRRRTAPVVGSPTNPYGQIRQAAHYNPGELGMQKFTEYCETRSLFGLLDCGAQLMVELDIEPNQYCHEWLKENHPEIENLYLEIRENDEMLNEALGGLWRGLKRLGGGLGAAGGTLGQAAWQKAKALGGDIATAGRQMYDKMAGPQAKYEEALIALQKLMAALKSAPYVDQAFKTETGGSLMQRLAPLVGQMQKLKSAIPELVAQSGTATPARAVPGQPNIPVTATIVPPVIAPGAAAPGAGRTVPISAAG